jgi:hypothetical protein
VIEAASMAIGLANGVTIPSSYFLMVFPDGREFVFADCAVNVAPDAAALEAIARDILGQCKPLYWATRGLRSCRFQPDQAVPATALNGCAVLPRPRDILGQCKPMQL